VSPIMAMRRLRSSTTDNEMNRKKWILPKNRIYLIIKIF